MKALFVNKIPDDLFYKLGELKARWKCDTWREFLKKVVENEKMAKKML